MIVTIQSLHFTAKQELNNFVTEKVSQLSHFYDKIESANVCLKLENSVKTENKICEIRLIVPGKDLFVKRHGKTFEEATHDAVDVLQQQIKKMKTKFD